MVTAPTAVSWRGVTDAGTAPGSGRFKRALGLALGTLAVGAAVALVVSLYDDQSAASSVVSASAARVQLPGDLFIPPRVPQPRVIIRYTAPRPAPPAAAAPKASAPAEPSPHPSPSGQPTPGSSPPGGGGGDD